jgi:hypothetical protein
MHQRRHSGYHLLLPALFNLLSACSSPARPTADAPPESAPTGPKPAPATLDEIPAGSVVEILDVAEGDAFYSSREAILAKRRRCFVRGFGLYGEEEGGRFLYEGRIRCGYGPEYYFSKVSVGVVTPGKIAVKDLPGKPFEGEAVPPGARVKILGFSPDDQLFPWPEEMVTRADELLRKLMIAYDDGDGLVGEVCEVAPETPLAGMGLSFGGASGGAASASAPASASAATADRPPAASSPASRPAGPRGLVATGGGYYGGALLCKARDTNTYKVSVYQARVEVL